MYEINKILSPSNKAIKNDDIYLKKGIYNKQNLLNFVLYNEDLKFIKRLKEYHTQEGITRQAGIYRLKQNIILSLKEGYYDRDTLITEIQILLNK